MKEFPVRSPLEKVGGLVHFGRMLDKIRLHARGELPEDYQPNLGRGFDAKLCKFLHLDYGELTKRVNEGATDDEILDWALTADGDRPRMKSQCGMNSCGSRLARSRRRDSRAPQTRSRDGGPARDRNDVSVHRRG